MLNLFFNVLDDGLPHPGRVVVLFRFETEARVVRSGMLNYDVATRRFVGPHKNTTLLQEAERFLLMHGCVPDLGGESARPEAHSA